MASFLVSGFINNIKYLPSQGGCLVFVSEYKNGYKKKDGTMVEDKYLVWKCIFRQGLVKYISEHFNTGMLVEVKGEVLPYAIEHGQAGEGVSEIGQTCNLYSYPRYNAKQELKMIKDSQLASSEQPNLESFNQPDF